MVPEYIYLLRSNDLKLANKVSQSWKNAAIFQNNQYYMGCYSNARTKIILVQGAASQV